MKREDLIKARDYLANRGVRPSRFVCIMNDYDVKSARLRNGDIVSDIEIIVSQKM